MLELVNIVSHRNWWCLLTLAGLSFLSAFAIDRTDAQDFKIYTSISDETNPQVKPTVVARSLTMFRAGKVYDYMDHLGELVVFEPALNRFVVLNGGLALKTEVTFPLLNQHLSVSEQKAAQLLAIPAGQPDAISAADATFLKFQLHPVFQIAGKADEGVLTMSSPQLTYQVKYSKDVTQETLGVYYHYIDWMARLNRILHPQAMFPQPRLVVNQELKKRGVMPISVTLRMSHPQQIQLKADHSIQWELDEHARAWINDWETLLKDPQVKNVSLVDYQRAFMSEQARAEK